VFVPVGGGGLIAGIATYLKYAHPNVRIIGVNAADSTAMYDSLRAGARVALERVGMFADGVAVRRVGEETFRLARSYVDEMMLVDTDEMCAGIQDIFEETRSIVEPAGALAVAAIKKYVARERCSGRQFVAINCGANMNFDRLRHVAERAEMGRNARHCWPSKFRSGRAAFCNFVACSGAAPSRNSTTATKTVNERASSSASR
jgi:threonine dehydratase